MRQMFNSFGRNRGCKLFLLVFIGIIITSGIPHLFPTEDFLPNTLEIVSDHAHSAAPSSRTQNIVSITDAMKLYENAAASKTQVKLHYSFSPSAKIKHPSYSRQVNVSSNVALDNVPPLLLSNEKLYNERMLDIRERCKTIARDEYSSIVDLQRFVVDHRHQSIMCVVPKNACTTWKSILTYLMGMTTREKAMHLNPKLVSLDRGMLRTMRRSSLPKAAELFSTYTKFMITRHPFDRLVSAYKDKFLKINAPYRYSHGRYIARNGLKEFLGANYTLPLDRKKQDDTIRSISLSSAFNKLSESDKKYVLNLAARAFVGSITFEEFLRYGVAEKSSQDSIFFDVHWRPQYHLCNPCAINFDFIVRFENLGVDSTVLLDYLQRHDQSESRIQFPTSRTSAVTKSVTKEYFEHIPQHIIESLKRIYKNDFHYFNYHPDDI